MKVVIATSAPFYWQPQAECFAAAMRERGHEAIVATLQTIDFFRGVPCDVLFCIGSGESLKPFLDALPSARKILYLIESVPTLTEADDFTRFKLSVHRAYLSEFGCVFVHTRRSVPTLQAIGLRRVEVLVWPHFPSIFRPVEGLAQDLDVLFVGTVSPYRKQILLKAGERFKVALGRNAFHANSAPLYSRAKIVLNIHFTTLPNFECRVIEALGCGAFLLTETLDPDDLLRDGEHLVMFREQNLLDLIGHYLPLAERRSQIAKAGCEAVQHYRVEIQADRVLEVARELCSDRPSAIPAPHSASRLSPRTSC